MVEKYDVVVIGSGFGGTINALSIAREFKNNPKHAKKKILILERGTWWTTPVGTVQDPEVKTVEKLRNANQPVQYWSSNNSFKGLIDIFTRCRKREGNVDGLLDFTQFGKKGLFGIGWEENDGISILRASGVGGGSLVYSNITIRPPELIFNNERWKAVAWNKSDRDSYYNLAREAIGLGVLYALDKKNNVPNPANKINSGLSNIVTRSAGLSPHWESTLLPSIKRIGTKRKGHDPNDPSPLRESEKDFANMFWIDRARAFQTAMAELNSSGLEIEYGTVDHSINDINPDDPANIYGKDGQSKNYCERQGRCNIGCLPGARHTLNKQLMAAVYGPLDQASGPYKDIIEIRTLCEVQTIRSLESGGYEIRYYQYGQQSLQNPKPQKNESRVQGTTVIVAAGTVGSTEIMLRSRRENTLSHLSKETGEGFSTNGDYLAYLGKTKNRVRLTRGPAQTSYGHFNMNDDGISESSPHFHSLEDLGIPPALATAVGFGTTLFNTVVHRSRIRLQDIFRVLVFGIKWLWKIILAPFVDQYERQDFFMNEDEVVSNIMLVTATGRESSNGKFRLGKVDDGETTLRLERASGKKFIDDPVYDEIKKSLEKLAEQMRDDNATNEDDKQFKSPTDDAVALSHPLGGCCIAAEASDGVVDEFGRVFNTSEKGSVYKGLYIADGSIVPYSIGVNPSLTISALALRISEKVIQEIK